MLRVEYPVNNRRVSKLDIRGHVDGLLIVTAYKPVDCSEEAEQLRNLMFGDYQHFSQKLMRLVHNKETTLSQRLQAIKVLNFLAPEGMQEDFEADSFIRLNLLMLEDPDEAIVFEFLGHFRIEEAVISGLLNSLFETEMTPRGFQALMSLIKSESYLLEHLKTLTKLIQGVMAKNSYSILRQNGIQGPLFDDSIFFNTQQHQSNAFLRENNLLYQTEDSKVLPSLIRCQPLHQGYQYDIALDGSYTISSLKLSFQANDQQQCKMRIQVFNPHQLIFDRLYPEWVYYYLALRVDKNMKIPLPNPTTSRLLVKVFFSYSNSAMTLLEKSQMPSDPLFLIPELEGYNKTQDIALEDINSKESVQLPKSSQYWKVVNEWSTILRSNHKMIEKDSLRSVKMLKIQLSNF